MSVYLLLTLRTQGKPMLLVNMAQASCVHQDGKRAVVCFDGACTLADGVQVRESIECIAKALGSAAVTPA